MTEPGGGMSGAIFDVLNVDAFDVKEKDGVVSCFFGRRGGVSRGLYDSLNGGVESGDDPAAVAENRRIAAAALGAGGLLSLRQRHSGICVTADVPWADGREPEGDALATAVPGLALAVQTADCAPVLLRGRRADGAPVVGAAHAGWRGAVGGVLERTIDAMGRLGAAPDTIHAAIGPCLGPRSYEVSAGFDAPFRAQDPANGAFFRPGARAGTLMFDLPAYVARRLALAGIGLVDAAGVDTCAAPADYFSYRRSQHARAPDYGRQLSAIMIRP